MYVDAASDLKRLLVSIIAFSYYNVRPSDDVNLEGNANEVCFSRQIRCKIKSSLLYEEC